MIQFNLLPDVKLEYIKAQRTRRLMAASSLLVTVVAVALLVLLFGYGEVQKKHISDLNNDITHETSQLRGKKDISKILTVQNQLNSLTDLHAGKPAASRLFRYVNQVTPAQVSITNLNIDLAAQTIAITGSADTLSSVNQYVDTLKFTTYKTNEKDSEATPAFSNVVMSSFGLSDDAGTSKPASYTIVLSYDPVIFNITNDVTLTVPNRVTTRSEAPSTSDLFQAQPSSTSSTSSTTKGQR
jgi:Tfp pilus assembly protein PilN